MLWQKSRELFTTIFLIILRSWHAPSVVTHFLHSCFPICNTFITLLLLQLHTFVTSLVAHLLHLCNTHFIRVTPLAALLLHLSYTFVTPLLHICFTFGTPLLHIYYTHCYTFVTPLLHICNTHFTHLLHPLLHLRYTVVTLISYRVTGLYRLGKT